MHSWNKQHFEIVMQALKEKKHFSQVPTVLRGSVAKNIFAGEEEEA